LDEHPNPSSWRKIVLPHIITSQETTTLTGKEFLWFENVKLWQQQGEGEDITVKGLYRIIQRHIWSIASSNCDIQATKQICWIMLYDCNI
jgi:hypothetical protein